MDWLKRVRDHRSISCPGCREIWSRDGVRPVCLETSCPVCLPGGVAGRVAALWSDLRELGETMPQDKILRAHQIEADRGLLSIIRYLEMIAADIFSEQSKKVVISK